MRTTPASVAQARECWLAVGTVNTTALVETWSTRASYLSNAERTIATEPLIACTIVHGGSHVQTRGVDVAVILVLIASCDDAAPIIPCSVAMKVISHSVHTAGDICPTAAIVGVRTRVVIHSAIICTACFDFNAAAVVHIC